MPDEIFGCNPPKLCANGRNRTPAAPSIFTPLRGEHFCNLAWMFDFVWRLRSICQPKTIQITKKANRLTVAGLELPVIRNLAPLALLCVEPITARVDVGPKPPTERILRKGVP